MRRVVVTGMGCVSPLGSGVDAVWDRLINGESGIRKIDTFDASDLAARIAGIVPDVKDGYDQPYAFNGDEIMEPRDQRKNDRFILFAMAAAKQALEDSDWFPKTEEEQCETGVMIGSGIGGLPWVHDTSLTLQERGPRRVTPFFIPGSLINLASGQVSIKYGLKGPNHSVVTACATGAHAIGDAAQLIQGGRANVMVAGGAESTICRIAVAGFAAAKALSTKYNDDPTSASRPWDEGRDGFVMGEGAGVLVLEEYEHAKARGAKIYGEVSGYGLSGDAHHITSPSPDGDGAYRAMKQAIDLSQNVSLDDIGYINAHGTSTPAGDVIEVKAVKRLFGDKVKDIAMSSTKSSIGHLLGAAGAVEAVFSLKALTEGVLPPTLNLENPSEGCDLNFVAHKSQKKDITAVMSNSFGFGGTNASLVFKKV